MEVFSDVLQFLANNIFREVAILIGLITLAGLWIQKKPLEDIVSGALRATIGVIVLFIGVDIFVSGLSGFQTLVSNAVGLEPPSSTNTMGDFLGQQGGTVALVITVAFFFHLLAVRLLRARYVYLTGHLMFWISLVVVAALVQVVGTDVSQWTLVLAGPLIVASYWTIQPMYMARKMRKVIGSDDWGYGHTSSSVAWAAAAAGPKLGDAEKHDTEELDLPDKLSFFKDVNVSTALVIGIIMVVAMFFADYSVLQEQAANYSESINPWMWGPIEALRFAAGIAILLFGVRMFLGEIIPAFRGISQRVIPGSRPALDVPTVFPYGKVSVMVGFVSGTAVFLVLMGIFAGLGWFVLVPPMIMLFFPGAGAAVFGNRFGGWRGAAFGGALNGLFLAVGQAVTWGMLSDTAPELATLADPDWYLIIWLVMGLGNLFGGTMAGMWVVTGLVVVGTLGWLYALTRGDRLEYEPAEKEPQKTPEDSGEAEEPESVGAGGAEEPENVGAGSSRTGDAKSSGQ